MPNFWPFGRSKRNSEQAPARAAASSGAQPTLEETVRSLVDLCEGPRDAAGTIPYGAETFAAVDAQFDAIAREVAEGETTMTVGLALNWGAYLGEMLRQHHGGSWATLVQVQLPATGVAPLVTPALFAYERFMGAYPLTTEAYVTELERYLEQAPTVAELMEARCGFAQRLAEARYSTTLDGTPESIRTLDQILDREMETLPDTSNPTRAAFREIVATQRAYVWGAFVGEVIRRNHGGWWQESTTEPFAVGTFLQGEADMLFPVQKVYKRFINGPEDALWPFYVMTRHVAGGQGAQ